MKILYVTGMVEPIKALLEGKTEDEITHAYQFFAPWYKLVQNGHQVDFIIASNFYEPYNIKVDWFKEKNIYANIYDPFIENMPWYKRLIRRIKRFTKLLYYTNKAINENNYDFVYCKAYYEGLAGNIVANLRGVPCGMRSMGTMLNEDFKKYGNLGTIIRRPIEFLTFKLDKKFFIMTNDGTKGDLVYSKWKPRQNKYKFLFWRTGIKIKTLKEINIDFQIPNHKYLFFAARIDGLKRHDRIINILNILHKKGCLIHLYFAGNTTSDIYHNKILNQINKFELNEYVHFLGPIQQDELKLYAYNAVANPLMSNISNLGNVFFELYSVGSVILGLNDGSLDEFITHEKTGFIINDEDHAANIIINILDNKYNIDILKNNAIENLKTKGLDSEERFDKEVLLIESFERKE